MKMYRTTTISIEIEELEVDRCTDHNVWYTHSSWGGKPRQNKEARISGYTNWYETIDEAKQALLNRLTRSKTELELSTKQVIKDIATLCS